MIDEFILYQNWFSIDCNSIIMMKKGNIIDKGTCKDLIQKHGRTNLEETFLKIVRSKDEF